MRSVSSFVFHSFRDCKNHLDSMKQLDVHVDSFENLNNVDNDIKKVLVDTPYLKPVYDFKSCDKIIKFTFVFDHTHITLWSFETKAMNKTQQVYKNIIEMLCYQLYILNKLNRQKKVVMVLGYSRKKKMLDKTLELGSDHVNSGFTWKGICVVYREQEMFKVMLHELMHHYGMDTHAHDETAQTNVLHIQQTFNITTKTPSGIRIEESYNDTMTCLFLIGLYIMFRNPDIRLESYNKLYKSYLEQTHQHMFDVAYRILAHYNIKHRTDFKRVKFIEHSSVFSYYICKAAIISRIDEFQEMIGDSSNWIMKNNQQLWSQFIIFLTNILVSKQFHLRLFQQVPQNTKSLNMMLNFKFQFRK